MGTPSPDGGCGAGRAKWLTEPNSDAEELFRMVGEVFIYWSKSHVSWGHWGHWGQGDVGTGGRGERWCSEGPGVVGGGQRGCGDPGA